MILWFVAMATAAEPYMAFEWRPLGRSDLMVVQEQRTSGLLVGEQDGFARPQAQLDVGAWFTQHVGLQGSLGIARHQITTWNGDIYAQKHWGVLRPGIDMKVRPGPSTNGLPVPWAIVGAHVDIPSSRDVSNGYTVDEQEQADQSASVDRVRLGALGARIGVGVEQRIIGGLSVGAQYTGQWQRSLFVRQDPTTISSLLTGEAALLLMFDWPTRPPDDKADGPDDT